MVSTLAVYVFNLKIVFFINLSFTKSGLILSWHWNFVITSRAAKVSPLYIII